MDYAEKRRRYILKQARHIELEQEKLKPAPACGCGCGVTTNWMRGKGWARYLKGHGRRKDRGSPPLCACGCGVITKWGISKGNWNVFLMGHTRRGKKFSDEHKQKLSKSMLAFCAKRRLEKGSQWYNPGGISPREPSPERSELLRSLGISVYTTYEFREARKRLVEGRPCVLCGSTEKIHAHHITPGDDSTLIPLCIHCHPVIHAGPDAKGQAPPLGEQPPLCACGCGLPVLWKRVRGWAQCRHGHAFSKIPVGTRLQEAPLCACGCGEPTKFRFGKGWNEYKRGHRQKIEGGYRTQKDGEWHEEPPLCKCGCGKKVSYQCGKGWRQFAHGHSQRGRLLSEEHKAKISEAAKLRHAERRNHGHSQSASG